MASSEPLVSSSTTPSYDGRASGGAAVAASAGGDTDEITSFFWDSEPQALTPTMSAIIPSNSRHIRRTGTFRNRVGLRVFVRHWMPEGGEGAVKGAVLLCHGMHEHSGRYDHVAAGLTAVGIAVFSMDLIGHGRSEAPGSSLDDRGFVEHFDDFADDCIAHARHMKRQAAFSSVPFFLLGHSMGGCIAISTALQDPSLWNGVVLSAPAVTFADVNCCTLCVAGCLTKHAPKTGVVQLEPAAINSDPKRVKDYQSDELNYMGPVRARLGIEMGDALKDNTHRRKDFTLPTLLIQGDDDRLCPPSGAREFIAEIASDDKTLKMYEGGCHHEIFNEERYSDDAIAMVRDWIVARLPGAPTPVAS